MNKRTQKITEGLRRLAGRPHEITSGTVVAGSVDTTTYTMSVQPFDHGEPIEGVLLNAIAGEDNGLLLIPDDDSEVIIGSVDGDGQWILLRPGKLRSMKVTIGNVVYSADSTQLSIQNGDTIINLTDSLVKVTTASESLYQLLKDCFTYITALTVPTSTGPSGVPINVADFNSLITRLDNLLAS